MKEALPKSQVSHLEEVSTARGSGWVSDQHVRPGQILNLRRDPPATAGGTDLLQVRTLD